MKVTASIREHLLAAARREFADAENEVNRLEQELRVADKNRDEKRATLSWVESLIVGTDLTVPASDTQSIAPTTWGTLYYIPSKSGDTRGHYIELFSGSNVNCSCPGFLNRGRCWASEHVRLTRPTSRMWLLSRQAWRTKRDEAIANPKQR